MSKVTSVVARQDDGGVQITFTLPKDLVLETKNKVLAEISLDTTVPGFRKGKAPLEKVEAAVSAEKLTEHVLSHILPQAFADSISENKINPAIYPKFEAVKIDENSDWEIRALTCELPEVKLGDYQKKIEGELRSKNIVVPGKESTKEDKQSVVIKTLLETIPLTIPQILVNEEVDARLSQLLARIEKLGLQLESYLKSAGKTPQALREEYEKQAREAISLELILNKIAEAENIKAADKDIDEFIKSTGTPLEKVEKEQRESLRRVITRNQVLEKLYK